MSTSSEASPLHPTASFGLMSQGLTLQLVWDPFQGHCLRIGFSAGFSIEWKFSFQFPAINYTHVFSQITTRYSYIPPSHSLSQYPDWCFCALGRIPFKTSFKGDFHPYFPVSPITYHSWSSKFMPAFRKVSLPGFFGVWEAGKKHCCRLSQPPHFAYKEMVKPRGQMACPQSRVQRWL